MTTGFRFVHTNIVAHDWRRLAAFYHEVFGCRPVLPARDLKGVWLEAATGVPGVRIQGMHLRLPGHGSEGPTLEIFQYHPEAIGPEKAVNRPGLAHIAFEVDDVEATCDAVLAAGGRAVGDLVSREISGVGEITFAYLADPEGNIVEVQRWSS
jgi:catechol 2,3-dioxygenase-like lactoylglutathione lyase family enzyme